MYVKRKWNISKSVHKGSCAKNSQISVYPILKKAPNLNHSNFKHEYTHI